MTSTPQHSSQHPAVRALKAQYDEVAQAVRTETFERSEGRGKLTDSEFHKLQTEQLSAQVAWHRVRNEIRSYGLTP